MPNTLQAYLDEQNQRRTRTPQTEAIPGTVANSAGGFSFPVDEWTQLDRFLFLGQMEGTAYIKPFALTKEHTKLIQKCLREDGPRMIGRAVDISEAGWAMSNDPALYVLAWGACSENEGTRRVALDQLGRVARTFTHLAHFLNYLHGIKKGWNRMRRRGVATWFERLSTRDLAYQAIKYPQRDGWRQKDVMILTHPKADIATRQQIFEYIMRGWPSIGEQPHPNPDLNTLWASERVKSRPDTEDGATWVVEDITVFGVPREAIPTHFLKHARVWAALAAKMPINALLRNLGNLTAKGVYTPGGMATLRDIARLTNPDLLKAGRVHPISILMAGAVYAQGHGVKGNLKWTPLPAIQDALEEAFYGSLAGVAPSGLRYYVGLDVSGSMAQAYINDLKILTPRNVGAALALMWARTQAAGHVTVRAFSHKMEDVTIRRNTNLEGLIRDTTAIPWARTDCALPMVDALARREPYDVFVVLTDSEHYAGKIHPVQALQQYRREMGIPARLVCVAMVANKFSVADKNDAGMLDLCGFDSSLPTLIDAWAGAKVAVAGEEIEDAEIE